MARPQRLALRGDGGLTDASGQPMRSTIPGHERGKLRRRLVWAFIAGIGMSLLTVLSLHFRASARLEVQKPPAEPFDAIIVPGCPSAADGSLTRCQLRRAMWAVILWERGYARHFITSGGAVASPYIEADALAAAMTALGVPAERIYLDPHALHTDENIYNAWQIARQQGWSRLAVASDRGQAVGACEMLEEWHKSCGAFSMDYVLVEQRLQAAPQLQAIRAEKVPAASFVPLKQREAERARRLGRRRRPPSLVLYPLMLLRKAFGWSTWQPFARPDEPALTWAARSRSLPR